jgi:hypothetical protein
MGARLRRPKRVDRVGSPQLDPATRAALIDFVLAGEPPDKAPAIWLRAKYFNETPTLLQLRDAIRDDVLAARASATMSRVTTS